MIVKVILNLLVLILCVLAQTNPGNTLLENGIQLKDKVGTALTPAAKHSAFSSLLSRMQDTGKRSTVLLPAKAVWGIKEPDYNEGQINAYIRLLKHHIQPHTLITKAVTAEGDNWQVEETMLHGEPLLFRKFKGRTQIMSSGKILANIVEANIPCSNGVIHIIDAPLLPDGLSIDDNRLVNSGRRQVFNMNPAAYTSRDSVHYHSTEDSLPAIRDSISPFALAFDRFTI